MDCIIVLAAILIYKCFQKDKPKCFERATLYQEGKYNSDEHLYY